MDSDVEAFAAIGEAWFRVTHMARLADVDCWHRNSTATFSVVLTALSADLAKDDPVLYEAARVLQAYRKIFDEQGATEATIAPPDAVKAAEALLELDS